MVSETESVIWTWIAITPFEILLHTTAIFISSILAVFRWGFAIRVTFWHMFLPLFLASALNLYFVLIILLRSFIEEKQLKRAIAQNLLNILRTLTIGIFEMLLCQKIEATYERGQVAIDTTYGVIFMPLWVLMTAMGIQACRLL
ncbi:hypothetical protein M3Y94_01184900 [Aphelenchoides besseyi]|nr:hypothetical protein M3Y94_01184900 [Aphelenchoides besseyi]KAI6228281.1 hypothetical protein M3Y95_00606100 [Aphelenchoides besseyi]